MNMPDDAMFTSTPRSTSSHTPSSRPTRINPALHPHGRTHGPGVFHRAHLGGQTDLFRDATIPWVARFGTGLAKIRHELDALLSKVNEIPNFQRCRLEQGLLLTKDDKWKTYFFYLYGGRVERNCRECPVTARLIGTIPGMKTAMFSVLGAHKALSPHRGPTKAYCATISALKVPEPTDRCGIRVGAEIRHWEEGRSLIFDDSHEHEAWNQTEDTRVVLFVDILRPLPFPFSLFNRLVVWGISRTPSS